MRIVSTSLLLLSLLLFVCFQVDLSKQMSFPPARPPPKERKFVSTAVDNEIVRVKGLLKDKDLAQLFENCFPNTLDTTIDTDANGDTFVITGDIDAMWLRDSTNQLKPYVAYTKSDAKLQAMLSSAIRSQATKILIDPYANAHYPDNNHVSPWLSDTTTKLSFANTHTPAMTTSLHERKFEIDSLLSFFELSTAYANATGDLSFATPTWQSAALRAVVVLRDNQRLDTSKCAGASKAPYTFARSTAQPSDTLQDGVGAPFRACGLIHSSFRPSDDALVLPFNIAQNAMAVVNLRAIATLADKISVRKTTRLAVCVCVCVCCSQLLAIYGSSRN
jgi:meiotically up-regulated gene 157 (Mug157) protein